MPEKLENPEKQKSDLSRAFSEDGPRKAHVGGQALIEGIMMRGKYNWAVAVREPGGGIYLEDHDLKSGRKKNGWMHWPLVRGCRAMIESLHIGYKALEVAAAHAFAEEEEEEEKATASGSPAGGVGGAQSLRQSCSHGSASGASGSCGTRFVSTADPAGCVAEEGRGSFSWKDDFGRPGPALEALGAQTSLEVVSEPAAVPTLKDSPEEIVRSSAFAGPAVVDGDVSADGLAADAPAEGGSGFGKKEMALSMVMGLAMGVVLFIVAPALVTNLIVGEYDGAPVAWNIVDGLLRVAVFVFYIWLIGRMSDVKRMFGYHGAEHKTIHCFEHGLPLTPENARSFPRLHVRCGTAFLIMVMIIAIFVYTAVPLNALIGAWGVPDGAPKLALVIAVRILLMPLIAGISYEITVKWAGSHPENPLVKVVLWPGLQMQYLTTNEPDDGMLECAIAAMKRVLEREEVEAAGASRG